MPEKELPSVDKPIFSASLIQKYTRIMEENVKEVYRKQELGLLPMRKRIPASVVTTRDVRIIIKRSERTAQRIMAKVRKKLKKKRGEYISVRDFSKATGIDVKTIQRALDMCT